MHCSYNQHLSFVCQACSIRQKLLTAALMMMTEYENLPNKNPTQSEIVRYNEIRLGWLDTALNAIQFLQFAESVTDSTMTEHFPSAKSPFLYNFGSETNPNQYRTDLPFELLQTSYSILSLLAPRTDDMNSDSQTIGSRPYAYSGDFVICMKQRNAMAHIQNHLTEASTVASLTYHAIYSATSTHEVNIIHKNAVSIVDKITTFTRTLADSSSFSVEVLEFMMEARFCRSFIENPLLKLCNMMWTISSQDQNTFQHVVKHRGYVPSPQVHRNQMMHHNDPVHAIWCKVIDVFTLMLRSVRLQSMVYAQMEHSIHQQLLPMASAALDFVSYFDKAIFSCFSSIHTKSTAKALADKKPKSTISPSSFNFTANLLKEASCIVQLFDQLCMGETKNKFMLSYSNTFNIMNTVVLDLARTMSTFLGSIGNARELFFALSSASKLSYDMHASMVDAHPLLADGETILVIIFYQLKIPIQSFHILSLFTQASQTLDMKVLETQFSQAAAPPLSQLKNIHNLAVLLATFPSITALKKRNQGMQT